jgi:hypothetical protein
MTSFAEGETIEAEVAATDAGRLTIVCSVQQVHSDCKTDF